MKNYLLILIFIFVSNCGYTTVYKNQKTIDFKISIQEMKGDKSINNLVKSKLSKFSSTDSENIYKIEVNSIYSKSVLSRDITGKASNLKLSTRIEFNVIQNEKKQNFLLKKI